MKKLIAIILSSIVYLSGMSQINTDQVMRIGQNALYFEDYMLSIQYFNLVIQSKPEQAKPYFYRSVAKFNLEDYIGAEEDATLAIERNPFLNDVWEIRGVARQNLGKYQEAIHDYNKALETLHGNKHILFNKALAQEAMGALEASDSTFKELMKYNPNYDRAYRGRSKLRLSQGDTLAAIADLDTALNLNKFTHEVYAMRAGLIASYQEDFEKALLDMNEAIRLHPQESQYYVIRAQINYSLDNLDGALDDYSYAIDHDSRNMIAYYNRAVLRTEINDVNRAIEDFSMVLKLNPLDYRTLYNRAILYKNIHDFDNALADITKVIEVLPDFPVAHFVRSEIYKEMGQERKANQEYDKSIAMVKRLASSEKTRKVGDPFTKAIEEKDPNVESVVASQFSEILRVNHENEIEKQYNNKDIRGSVQNKDVVIEPEPMFVLSYYATPSELRMGSYYIKEVDDINATRLLRFNLVVINRESGLLDKDMIAKHFESIDYFNSYIATHTPRAIDYFGRALDFVVTRNYKSAIEDLNKAISLTPNFSLSYFLRAVAKYNQMKIDDATEEPLMGSVDAAQMKMLAKHAQLKEVLDDWNRLIDLQPRMAIAYFNKGNTLLEMQDYVEAIQAFDKAIQLDPVLGEAYYNRGYIYLKMGNKERGVADLSKAGELGVIPSYNLLKRLAK